ncbi:MAG: SDR family NAD(P)-dependent oxidoreductase [Rhodospirillales bacterium]|nr:SDR family NAD(P)-dependent oxidoreductase [Rhodospirillales bacterium]MSP79554.1 SDR family NAD(P)-dependent oxidoreductase [Rhodospirillales bacterium]
MPLRPQPSSILITGASSGLGRALAVWYARPSARLCLSGRDSARLAETHAACVSRGANVEVSTVDVTDRAAMSAWIAGADAAGPLDLVIANAGISGGTGGQGEDETQTRAIFEVNFTGVVNTVWPAIRAMRPRRRGQIAIIASLAGYRGLPGAPAYAASKAAAKTWGEGLRGWLKPDGISVNVVCPGFVTTRMTAANRFPMPFRMDADKAAGIIAAGLGRDKPRISFPWPLAFATWLFAALPPAWTDPLLARMPRKGNA